MSNLPSRGGFPPLPPLGTYKLHEISLQNASKYLCLLLTSCAVLNRKGPERHATQLLLVQEGHSVMPGLAWMFGVWDGQAATPQGLSLRVCIRSQVARPPKSEQNCPMHVFQERGPTSFMVFSKE